MKITMMLTDNSYDGDSEDEDDDDQKENKQTEREEIGFGNQNEILSKRSVRLTKASTASKTWINIIIITYINVGIICEQFHLTNDREKWTLQKKMFRCFRWLHHQLTLWLPQSSLDARLGPLRNR